MILRYIKNLILCAKYADEFPRFQESKNRELAYNDIDHFKLVSFQEVTDVVDAEMNKKVESLMYQLQAKVGNRDLKGLLGVICQLDELCKKNNIELRSILVKLL